MLTEAQLDALTFQWGINGALIFCAVLFPIRAFLRRLSIKRIPEKLAQNEQILMLPKFDNWMDIALPLIIGFFAGAFLYPFFVFPGLPRVDGFPKEFLPIAFPITILLALLIIYLTSFQLVITSKKVFFSTPNKSADKFQKLIKKAYSVEGIFYNGKAWFEVVPIGLFNKQILIKKSQKEFISIIGFKNFNSILSVFENEIPLAKKEIL